MASETRLTMRKKRVLAKTSARGYGRPHQKLLAAALARWQPGDLCSRCGEPMWQRWTVTPTGRRVSAIHLDHTEDRTGYLGLSHAKCNTSAGNASQNRARMTVSRSRRTDVTVPKPSRDW